MPSKAVFPVIAEVPASRELFNIVFFAVLVSTLLQGTTAPVEISRQLGLEAETIALDQAISAGLIGPPEYAAQVYELYRAAEVCDAIVRSSEAGQREELRYRSL